MFTTDTSDENKVIVNPVQYSPGRLAIYSINKYENQVIGFEFVSKKYESNPRCCGSAIVNLCVPIEIIQPLEITKAEFLATDDTCYKIWEIDKKVEPDIELQLDSDSNVTGILVRFFETETQDYPLNMAFRLYGFDSTDCRFLLSAGLLMFR